MYIGTIFSVNKSKDDKKRWPTGYSLTEIFIQTCGTALKKKKTCGAASTDTVIIDKSHLPTLFMVLVS